MMDLHHGHVQMNKDFWHNKNVLITGVTGFKGSWLALWLESSRTTNKTKLKKDTKKQN